MNASQLLVLTSGNDPVLCPQCGFDYLHIDTVEMRTASGKAVALTGRGEDEMSTVNLALTGEKAQGRRHEIVLTMWCEGGCRTELVLEQHKGQTFVRQSALARATDEN
jgi:hypothetical protein